MTKTKLVRALIARGHPITQRQLEQQAQASSATVLTEIGRLEEQGLVAPIGCEKLPSGHLTQTYAWVGPREDTLLNHCRSLLKDTIAGARLDTQKAATLAARIGEFLAQTAGLEGV